MPTPSLPAAARTLLSEPQHTRFAARATGHVRMVASVRVTTGGILAIGVMVSCILLSTSVLVGTAVRESRARRG
ncbi:hypothetical protein [Sphingomonas sanxanigenens]|uniref:Uncharacterized protein n=1 Tax=Sphingomonas sanxanigenens DSM 19645 = NX02 TaxID=1123269 RepID=W0AHF3_9SPHN|nr:hypothetical protein [Sphingomonas sanxanigenens]AHE57344.1 hypothetical protein NX02_28875 [Sphingomonas sanxanigenens DSM 19645 = NX02]